MGTLMVVAGEASGDLHGGEILSALHQQQSAVRVVGVGGSHMNPYLCHKVADVADLGVMGLVEPILKLPTLLRLQKKLLHVAKTEGVTDLLTIDYATFNFFLARKLKRQCPHIRLHHFVCPQVWAWKAGRIPKLGHLLDTLYCLFDFEPGLFKPFPVDAKFVGNPLIETVKPEMDRSAFLSLHDLSGTIPIVALLPGSRMGEISRLLPPLVETVKQWEQRHHSPALQWVMPLAPTLQPEVVMPFLQNTPIRLMQGCSYAARAYASAALVCSGTATLETALLGTPFATIYRMHPLSLAFVKRVVKVPWFSLVNIVAQKPLVTELLQEDVSPTRLIQEIEHLLDPQVALPMRQALLEIRCQLGEPGAASRVAKDLASKMGPPPQTPGSSVCNRNFHD